MTNEIKIPLTFCRLLQKLSDREKIPVGKFASKINKELLHRFKEEDVLQLSPYKNTSYVSCNNNKYLQDYLKTYGINDLTEYIKFLEKSETTKAEAAQITSNSKHKNIRVYKGFFVKTYIPLVGMVNEQQISLNPIPGISLYIENYKTFTIDKNITIVGIENPETFQLIENYKHLFFNIKPLFLLRHNNNSYISWLQNIKNDYLHFGDFDLSAIAIYITEFRNKLTKKRCDFLIPENIEELIKNSNNRKDYFKQLGDTKVKSVNFDDYPEISKLANLINKEKRTLEQEALMKKN